LAGSVRRRNPEYDLDAGVVDFDPTHENTDDLLHAGDTSPATVNLNLNAKRSRPSVAATSK
jgi:hypothetical protein